MIRVKSLIILASRKIILSVFFSNPDVFVQADIASWDSPKSTLIHLNPHSLYPLLWLIISWNKSYGTIIPGCHPCYHLCIAASIVYIIAFAQLGYPSAFKLCYSPVSSFLCITGLIMGCWTVDRSVYWVVCGWVNVSLYDISVKFSFCRSIQNFSFNIIYEPEWHTGSQLGLGIGPTKFWLSESFFYLLIVSRKFVFFILQN